MREAQFIFEIRFVSLIKVAAHSERKLISILGEQRSVDYGQVQRCDICVCGEVGHSRTEIGINALCRLDNEVALFAVVLYILHFEYSDYGSVDIEGLGFLFRALDFYGKSNEIQLFVIVYLSYLTGKLRFDIQFVLRVEAHSVEFEGKLFSGYAFKFHFHKKFLLMFNVIYCIINFIRPNVNKPVLFAQFF